MKTFNKIGIVIAIMFGILLLFVSAKDNTALSIDPETITKSIIEKTDCVTPSELNKLLTKKDQNITIIDIRAEKDFEKGSIPTAENIPVEKLLKKSEISYLPKDKPVIIYSNGNSDANKVWVILKASGIKAFVLEGGFNYWGKFPTLPKNALSDDEILTYNMELEIANSLKGIRSKGMSEDTSKPVKKTKSKSKKRKKGKKKLEGC